MAEKPYRITVDVEGDWGGRVSDISGIKEGIPRILWLLKRHSIKALFFISTEIVEDTWKEIDAIQKDGHALGSHGHFHITYDSSKRCYQDRNISDDILKRLFGVEPEFYRAPKFNKLTHNDCLPYSNLSNHVGLLKYTWFGGEVSRDSIIYLHPFDIIGGNNPPNLFCRVWYSRPDMAYSKLKELLHEDMSNQSP
mgnify:CR=1 FL=1